MLIINADDWGGWPSATDAALECSQKGRLSSVSAMVFMADSERAAGLARDHGLKVGLHLNFTHNCTGLCPPSVRDDQSRVRKFLTLSKYTPLVYQPLLRESFQSVYEAQHREFRRLYGVEPTHVDGHQHMHLCMNMLLDPVIPPGVVVRGSFSFSKGEKSWFNRKYRDWVNRRLTRRHKTTDLFFSLETALKKNSVPSVARAAEHSLVELMAHPEKRPEREFLMGDTSELQLLLKALQPRADLQWA